MGLASKNRSVRRPSSTHDPAFVEREVGMHFGPRRVNRWWIGCLAVLQATTAYGAQPRLFDMKTETGMPHLEENLRYAVVNERRCIGEADLATAFWMLNDVSLQDCRLERTAVSSAPDGTASDTLSYVLICTGGHGTSGTARWHIENDTLSGTLDVRLGGKNMTFFQRITARAVGDCPAH